MSIPPFIQFDHITKKFGKKVVLDDLNLNIPYGKIFGIIGSSGSGKTTILNILVGFLKPNDGKVLFQSRDIRNDMRTIEKQFGFAAQDCSFYDNLTVQENLYYFGNLYGLNSKELKVKTNELVSFVELEDAIETLGSRLSMGMKRRLDIACSLINKPKVLILDEPTQDLDPILRREIITLIRRLNKEENTTVIITSHLLGEIEELCDEIGILQEGKIVEIGSPSFLKKKYSKRNLDDVFEAVVSRVRKDRYSKK